MSYTFRVDVPPPNGRPHKATVKVCGEGGAVVYTDQANLLAAAERERLAKRLADRTGGGRQEILDQLEKSLGEVLARQTEAQATTPEPLDGGVAVNEAADDPHRLARLFADDHRHEDGLALRYWRGEWFRWDGRAWRAVPDKDLRASLCARVKAEFDRLNLLAQQKWRAAPAAAHKPTARRVTGRLLADVLQALTSLAILPADTEEPSWLLATGREAEAHDPAEILVCANGLAPLPVLASEGLLEPCTPNLFSTTALDYPFNAKAPPPKAWLDFLGELWPDDPEAVQALQEWFGYCLAADTRQQKILMVVGPPRSGKGTIARVLQRAVGERNVCAPTLAGLGANFGLQPLLGKTLAIISDARLSGRTDVAVVVERLLSVSGEDPQTVDRKHLPSVTTKLKTRFLILTNELPRLNDASGALASRVVLLALTRSWCGKEDTKLTDRLLGELPGILNWAIEGWQRLRVRGHFLQPASARKFLTAMEDLSSPIRAFLCERCKVDPAADVFVDDLFQAWECWCKDKGRKGPGTKQMFGRDLLAALPSVGQRRPRDGEYRHRVYTGLRLLGPDETPQDGWGDE